jgi:hypothetical protein
MTPNVIKILGGGVVDYEFSALLLNGNQFSESYAEPLIIRDSFPTEALTAIKRFCEVICALVSYADKG